MWLRGGSWGSVAERGGWGSMAEGGGSWRRVAEGEVEGVWLRGEVGGVWLRGGSWGSVAERGKLGECG